MGDEDQWSADDHLGVYDHDLTRVVASPREWHTDDVKLKLTMKSQNNALLRISCFWEPSAVLPEYGMRIAGVCSFAVASGFQIVSLQCRWQPSTVHEGGAKQPGVSEALVLGAVVTLLGTVLHFILVHVSVHRLEELAAARSSAKDMFSMSPPSPVESQPVLICKGNMVNVSKYQMDVIPQVSLSEDLYLPVMVLAWLAPVAGFLLMMMALALQSQHWMLFFKAGEMCAMAACFSIATGLILCQDRCTGPEPCVLKGSNVRRSRSAHHTAVSTFHSQQDANSPMERASTDPCSRERKRDKFKHMIGLKGSHKH